MQQPWYLVHLRRHDGGAAISARRELIGMDEQAACPNCGEPVGDSDVVCPNCGESLVGG